MNHRDSALAVMRGEPVDHIQFIARMDLWYSFHRNRGTLPKPYERADLWDIRRDMGNRHLQFRERDFRNTNE